MSQSHEFDNTGVFIIVDGDPFNGLGVHGVYDSCDEAAEVASIAYHATPWWVVEIKEGSESIDPRALLKKHEDVSVAITEFERKATEEGAIGYVSHLLEELKTKLRVDNDL